MAVAQFSCLSNRVLMTQAFQLPALIHSLPFAGWWSSMHLCEDIKMVLMLSPVEVASGVKKEIIFLLPMRYNFKFLSLGEQQDDDFFSWRASKSPKHLCNYFRPHHWCFTLISVHQITFRWMFLLLSVHFFRTHKTHTPLWEASQNCSDPQQAAHSLGMCMYALCQQSCSQSTWGKELLCSHLNIEATPGETTKCTRWRGQESTVSFTGLQTTLVFCFLSAYESQLCLICWWQQMPAMRKDGKMPGGISHFTLLLLEHRWLWWKPRWAQQVSGGEEEQNSPLKIWGSYWPPFLAHCPFFPCQPAGWRKDHSPPPHSTAGTSAAAIHNTTLSFISGHDMKHQMRSWKAAVCVQQS